MCIKIKNLNDIKRSGCMGIYKRCLYDNKNTYEIMCNYMEKIRYCIEDLNSNVDLLNQKNMKDVVFIIVVCDWLISSYKKIVEILNQNLIKLFKEKNENDLKKCEDYLRAIRSFIVAHPLNTDRHKKYGFNGDLFCSDIRFDLGILGFKIKTGYYHLCIDGLKEGLNKDDNVFLKCYTKESNKIEFWKVIGINICDVFKIAERYVDEIYKLDSYLCKQKKFAIRNIENE